ncbi:hypothetical protein [Nocardia rhizosphaerihabitans]|uniref:Lipoprotein n=1 Tax=Nocardia rhizosphaerihabitans TaxID=1691570 RepID=A0ABQ2KW74_9NOCA|nr:hypothetical protein [Nocardia rhizosphaerihabitans]GGN94288.1 hypothetical protein GCM10011610_57070 [Nocardia rhizosphaerihabitans]
MIRSAIATSVIVTATAVLGTGCAAIESSDSSAQSSTCATKFRFGTAEPLGLISRFADQANSAASTGSTTTMRSIAASAGWKDGWDRVVEVPQGITIDELNRRTGADSVCWNNVPEGSSSDAPQKGYYLFLDGTQPVQSTSWSGKHDRAFDFTGTDQILADTPLIGTGQGTLRPA